MEIRPLLPLVDEPPAVRADAARNRELLLRTAEQMISECGIDALTMDALAAAAGVGKGTVFRRFESREGLMGALLNHTEMAAQGAVMFGPPPLGPGAEPWDRLVALGRARIDLALGHAELIRAAGSQASRSYAAFSFVATHVRYLFGELGVQGDIQLLAASLMTPLEAPVLEQQVRHEGISLERVHEAWVDLARRIVEWPG